MRQQSTCFSLFLAATIFILTICACPAHADPTVTPGGLLRFSSDAEFFETFPDLHYEDFEESSVADTGLDYFGGPLDSTTSNADFSPGDIEAGLSINTVTTSNPTSNLFTVGGSFPPWGNVSKAVGTTYMPDNLRIEFSGTNVNAVGMLVMNAGTADTATVTIYGPAATVLETLSLSLLTTYSFFGIYSAQPISKITIENDSRFEIVDNVWFGGVFHKLTFYNDQASFEAAHPGLTVEDFEESTIGDTASDFIAEPLDSTTSNAYFAPGDIVDGLRIKTLSTLVPGASLATVGGSFPLYNNSSKDIATRYETDNLEIIFPLYTAYAVGMDLMFGLGATDATILVYNARSQFLGMTTWPLTSMGETFFGVFSNDAIGWIAVINYTQFEFVDNIRFGGSPTALTFYRTEADFRKTRSNLPVEDFSESPVADGAIQACNEPINSTTNQAGCFAPGDILPGVTFRSEHGTHYTCPACMTIYGPNTSTTGNTTPMLSAPMGDSIEAAFHNKNVNLVGMTLLGYTSISVYDTNDILLGTAFNTGSLLEEYFWGVKSRIPIGRITVWGPYPLIDTIMFGPRFPWFTLPAITGQGGNTAP